MIDLDEADRLGKAATPLPWIFSPLPDPLGDDLLPQDIANSEWQVFARNNWQSLVDELRQVRSVASELMATCETRLRELVGERDEARAAAKELREIWLSQQAMPDQQAERMIEAKWPWLNS